MSFTSFGCAHVYVYATIWAYCECEEQWKVAGLGAVEGCWTRSSGRLLD